MRHNPNEGDPASDRIDKLAVEQAGAVAEQSQSDSELLRALAVEPVVRGGSVAAEAVSRGLAGWPASAFPSRRGRL